MDAERRELERRFQILNSRAGLSGDDAEYLKEYLTLNEEAVAKLEYLRSGDGSWDAADGKFSRETFISRLGALNERFATKVGDGIIKTQLLALVALKAGAEVGSWSDSTKICEKSAPRFIDL